MLLIIHGLHRLKQDLTKRLEILLGKSPFCLRHDRVISLSLKEPWLVAAIKFFAYSQQCTMQCTITGGPVKLDSGFHTAWYLLSSNGSVPIPQKNHWIVRLLRDGLEKLTREYVYFTFWANKLLLCLDSFYYKWKLERLYYVFYMLTTKLTNLC